MALTINNFVGFETGDTTELLSVDGTLTFPAGRSGTFSILLDASGDSFTVLPTSTSVADAGGNYIIGFAFKMAATTSSLGLFNVIDSAGASIMDVVVLATSSLLTLNDATDSVLDTSVAAYDDGEWHYIEIYADLNSASGDWEWFIDGVSEGSGAGADLTDGNSWPSAGDSSLLFLGNANVNMHYDDIYILSGATASTNRLGDATLASMPEIFGYSHSVTGATPTVGDDLNAGGWEDTIVAAGNGEYTAAGLTEGAVDFDGPNGDANVDGDSNIKAIKYWFNVDRDGGGGSTHHVLLGNSSQAIGALPSFVDGVDWPEITQTPADYFIVSEASLPTASQDITAGFGITSGGQDIHLYNSMVFLLHVPDADTGASGAIAQTLPSLTQSATASSIGGPIAQTLPSLTQSATAVEVFTSTIAQTLPSLTQSAAASVMLPVTGAIAQTLPSLTQSATAVEVFTSTITQTLPSLTQSATAVEKFEGPIAQTLPSLTQTANATVTYSAAITQTLPSLAQSATANVVNPVTGAIAQTLPSLTQSSTAIIKYTATIGQTLPSLTQAVVSKVTYSGAIAQTLPSLTQSATANTGTAVAGVISQTLPSFTQSATAIAEVEEPEERGTFGYWVNRPPRYDIKEDDKIIMQTIKLFLENIDGTQELS